MGITGNTGIMVENNCLFLHKKQWGRRLQFVYARPDGEGGWNTISETTIKMDQGDEASRGTQIKDFLSSNGLSDYLSEVGNKLRALDMVK